MKTKVMNAFTFTAFLFLSTYSSDPEKVICAGVFTCVAIALCTREPKKVDIEPRREFTLDLTRWISK